MKSTASTLTNIILWIVLFGSVFFVGITSSQVTYDPLLDVTGDGYGGIDDIVRVAEHFGASGTPINWTQVLENITALEDRVTALEEGTDAIRAYANVQVIATIGNQITITFPVGMFTSPPHLSVTAYKMTGAWAGDCCYIKNKAITATNAILDLQYWSGAIWQDVDDAENIQMSYVAIENRIS